MKYINTIIDAFAILALALMIIFLLFIGWRLMDKTTNANAIADKSTHTPYYTKAEYKRLSKKHGNPVVVIEEPGIVPYYYNQKGKKCKLI